MIKSLENQYVKENYFFVKSKKSCKTGKVFKNAKKANLNTLVSANKKFYSTGEYFKSHCGIKRLKSDTMPDWILANSFVSNAQPRIGRYSSDSSASWNYSKMVNCPKILEQYLQVASQIHLANQWPLVHGQNAAWKISQTVLKAIGYTGLQCFRLPSQSTEKLEVEKEIYKKIQRANLLYSLSPLFGYTAAATQRILSEFYFDWRIDHLDMYRDSLLSTTVGALHATELESPFSFAFTNNNSGPMRNRIIQDISIKMIQTRMYEQGYSKSKINEAIVQLLPLYKEATTLPIGLIQVIGLPKEMFPFAYHCTPYGIPTGKPLGNIRKVSSSFEFNGVGHGQVRLILSGEVVNSKRISVTNVMEFNEVKNYDAKQVEECMEMAYNSDNINVRKLREGTEEENSTIEQHKAFTNKIDQWVANYL